MYFKYVFQLLVFQLLHNTVESCYSALNLLMNFSLFRFTNLSASPMTSMGKLSAIPRIPYLVFRGPIRGRGGSKRE